MNGTLDGHAPEQLDNYDLKKQQDNGDEDDDGESDENEEEEETEQVKKGKS